MDFQYNRECRLVGDDGVSGHNSSKTGRSDAVEELRS